ncbi:hypothetical protein [Wenyingzhuangia marina]|uniref:Glycine dehydrogenase n=1 Tax=Wenyingzhuangia marina TaxID=1195760 RepID=A0A1M5S3Z9_9FLAO|nr:hypothetical protein [Wenyingzhuangia marina]GGF78634.1 hypothetical protein GCM10011397_22100 [Wenyingzhuangia marina]SHH32683.1 hypothetical protein SAMN05444281_0094 [Wenyingzhuangia marina]
MGKIKITCEEATTICSKAQYGEATFLEKIKLNLHFMYCKVCKVFSKQNSKLSTMCCMVKKQRELSKCCLSEEDKAKLKQQIKELEKTL